MAATERMFRCAATQYGGKTYIGKIHPIIYDGITNLFPEARLSDMVEGFVTKTGVFLSREDAKQFADALDLVRPGHDKHVDTKLWSEYLIHGTLEEPEFVELV